MPSLKNFTRAEIAKMAAAKAAKNAPAAVAAPIATPAVDTRQTQFTQAADLQVAGLGEARKVIDPFRTTGQVGFQNFAAGATPQGLESNLNALLGGDLLAGLVDARRNEVEGALSAGGLTRSGEAIESAAEIPTDIALFLEQLLSGRQESLGETGFGAAEDIAGLETNVGAAGASGILGFLQDKRLREIAQRQAKSAKSAAKTDAFGNIISAGIGGALSFFSDPRLKENIRKVSEIGPLDLVEWDWIPETKGTIVEDMPTIGFLSTQVRLHHPEAVGTFGGFDTVNYPEVLRHYNAN